MVGEEETTEATNIFCNYCCMTHSINDPGCVGQQFSTSGEEIEYYPMNLGEADTPPIVVASGEVQTIILPCPDPDEIRDWPRYIICRKGNDNRRYLALYNPELTDPARRIRPFTNQDFKEYLIAVNAPEPDIRDSSTWGRSEEMNLKVCRLQKNSRGRIELVFDPDLEWTFTVYNLDSSQPNWRELIERTLMIFPIEYLRAVNLTTIFLDFKMGTSHLGVLTDDGRDRELQVNVGSGGVNWTVDESLPESASSEQNDTIGINREMGESSDAVSRRFTVIGVTYAALNRVWGDTRIRDSNLPLSCEDIDKKFSDQNKVADTIYHEFGHLYLNTRRRREYFTSEEEYKREIDAYNVINIRREDNEEKYDNYRIAIDYAQSGGRSQGAGEGFAEACRKLLKGGTLDGGDAGDEMRRILDEAGFPSHRSVQIAKEKIKQHLNSQQG